MQLMKSVYWLDVFSAEGDVKDVVGMSNINLHELVWGRVGQYRQPSMSPSMLWLMMETS